MHGRWRELLHGSGFVAPLFFPEHVLGTMHCDRQCTPASGPATMLLVAVVFWIAGVLIEMLTGHQLFSPHPKACVRRIQTFFHRWLPCFRGLTHSLFKHINANISVVRTFIVHCFCEFNPKVFELHTFATNVVGGGANNIRNHVVWACVPYVAFVVARRLLGVVLDVAFGVAIFVAQYFVRRTIPKWPGRRGTHFVYNSSVVGLAAADVSLALGGGRPRTTRFVAVIRFRIC